MDHDVQPADRRLRRTSAIVLTLAAAAALLLVLAFRHWLALRAEALSTTQLVFELRRGIGGALLAAGLCLLLLAGHALRQARRIAADGRWPPAGMRMLRDTPVRRGAAALRIRRRRLAGAAALVALAAGCGAAAWRLLAQSL